MNKLKSKWLVEIAAKNLSTKLVKFFCSKLKTGTLVTVLEDFSNLSGIWNGQLLNKHEGADKVCLHLDQKVHGDVKILY